MALSCSLFYSEARSVAVDRVCQQYFLDHVEDFLGLSVVCLPGISSELFV